MTEFRGGLRYSIEVKDDFTTPLRRFREELAKTKEAARSGRINASQARTARAATDPEGAARTKNAQETGKALKNNTKELQNQGRISRLATTRAKQETAEIRKQEVAERKRGSEVERQSKQRIQQAKEVTSLEKEAQTRKVQAAQTNARLERESLKTKKESFRTERSQQQARQSALRADGQAVRNQTLENTRDSKSRIDGIREQTAEIRKTRAEGENASRARINRIREEGREIANTNSRRSAADIRSIRRAKELTEEERKRTQVQKTNLNAKRAETQELNRQRAQLLLLRAQERGRVTLANTLRRALQRVNQVSGRLVGNFITGAGRLLGFTAVFAAFAAGAAAIRAAASAFLNFNVQVEKAQLGIAALLTAVGTVSSAIDANVQGAQALVLAQAESVRQTALLRKEGLQTAATFEQLLDTFQQALGPGLQAGLDVDQIRKFSVRISQAASAIGVPQNQLAEEIRSLLAGTINPRTTRIATSLGITNEDIRRAKEAGDLIGLLNKRFAAFDEAGKASLNTFEAIVTNTKDAFAQLLGTAGVGLFDNLKTSLQDIFDLVTDRDPLTGALLPDPVLVARLEPLFEGLSAGLSAFREQAEGIRGEDLEGTLTLIGKGMEQVGVFAGILVRSITRLGKAYRDLRALTATVISNPFGSGDQIIKQTQALIKSEDAALARARAVRINARDTAAFSAQVKGLSGATITSNAALAQTQVTLDALAKAREKALTSGGGAGGGVSKAELLATKELARLDKVRLASTLRRAAAATSLTDALARRTSLSEQDRKTLDRVVRSELLRQRLSARASELAGKVAEIEERRQAAKEQFRASEAKSLEAEKKSAQDTLEAFEAAVARRATYSENLLRDLDNRGEILALARQQLKAQADLKAVEKESKDLAQAQLDIKKAAAALDSSQAGAKAVATGEAVDKTLLSEQKQLARLQDQIAEKRLKAAGASEEDLISAREKLAIGRRDVLLQERKASLLEASTVLEQRAISLQREAADLPKTEVAAKKALIDRSKELVSLSDKRRAQSEAIVSFEREQAKAAVQRTAFLREANASTQDALDTLNRISTLSPVEQANALEAVRDSAVAAEEWRDATYEVRESSDAITQALTEQAKLERAAARSAKDRAEAARLSKDLTETTRGNTGGTELSSGGNGTQVLTAKGGVRFGSRDGLEAAGNDLGLAGATSLGNSIGGTIAKILNESVVSALVLGKDDQGKVVNSFKSLFESIADAAKRTFEDLKTPAGIFALLSAGGGDFGGAGSSPGGQVGGSQTGPISSGFNKGGLVRAGLKAQASLAHYASPRGFASGGAPRGLHPSDNIPVWVGAGEYIHPTSAVHTYGTQFMEAVRRLEIDPLQARALVGARRRPFKPQTGGFATGGQVSSGISSPAAAAGPSMAFIVSSPDQLDNLLQGGAGALEDYMGRNAGEIRSRLGL